MALRPGGQLPVDRLTVTSAIRAALGVVVDDRSPYGTSVLLDGPPGIGKTHVLRGLLAELPPDVLICSAVGREQTRHEAFSVVRQIIPDLPIGMDPAAALMDRIDQWCSAGPVVIWVDDVHFADAASLAVLRLLVGASRNLPLVVLVGARGFPAPPHLGLLAAEVAQRATLAPMDQMMLDRLVFEHGGRWPGPRLRRVLASAGGNPLFAVVLLRHHERAAALEVSGAEHVEIRFELPPVCGRVQDIVRGHLQQLDGPSLAALRALAVWGTQGRLPDLAVVAGQSIEQNTDAYLVTARAGVTLTDASGLVQFVHDVYREVVLADTPEPLRRHAHRAAAQVLTAAGRRPELVAEHLLRAEPGNDTTRSQFLHALVAAVAATEAHAPEVATDLLEEADAITQTRPQDREALLLQRVRNSFYAGRGEAAERLVRGQIASVGDREVAAALQTLLTRSLINRAETDGALTAVDLTLAVPGLPGPVHRQLQATRCWVQLLAGLPIPAGHTETLLARFETVADVEAQASILLTMACAEYLAGRSASALALTARRDALANDRDGFQARSTAAVWPPTFTLAHAGPVAARAALAQARRRNLDRGTRWTDGFLAATAGVVELAAGEWDAAAAEFDAALDLSQETGTGWISIPTGLRSYIDAHRGDLQAATDRLDAFRRRRLPLQFGQDHPGLAELAILEAAGSTTAAHALGRALWRQARVRPGIWAVELAVDVTRVALAAADRRLAEQIAADLESVPCPAGLAGVNHLVHGMTARNADDIAAGAALLSRAGQDVLEAYAWEELADAAASSGDHGRAVHALDLALAGFRRFGAVKDTDRALARLRSRGVRRGSREANRTATFGWPSLTPAELRVATLVADGLTNREIGTRLYVSPRTIQTHIAHILAKTGLRSRVDVAAHTASRAT